MLNERKNSKVRTIASETVTICITGITIVGTILTHFSIYLLKISYRTAIITISSIDKEIATSTRYANVLKSTKRTSWWAQNTHFSLVVVVSILGYTARSYC